jgi:hypothetical protein
VRGAKTKRKSDLGRKSDWEESQTGKKVSLGLKVKFGKKFSLGFKVRVGLKLKIGKKVRLFLSQTGRKVGENQSRVKSQTMKKSGRKSYLGLKVRL